ncbi:MAG: HU family DNA-binding protein [Akkermansia sp.]|nr:HU family DNA-binding protein [Akkermansia sp.]
MNRQGLQELVRHQLGGTATPMAAQMALDAVLRSIAEGINQDGEVKLAHFGTFRVKKREPRRLLLPGSATEWVLPSREVVTFKAR